MGVPIIFLAIAPLAGIIALQLNLSSRSVVCNEVVHVDNAEVCNLNLTALLQVKLGITHINYILAILCAFVCVVGYVYVVSLDERTILQVELLSNLNY